MWDSNIWHAGLTYEYDGAEKLKPFQMLILLIFWYIQWITYPLRNWGGRCLLCNSWLKSFRSNRTSIHNLSFQWTNRSCGRWYPIWAIPLIWFKFSRRGSYTRWCFLLSLHRLWCARLMSFVSLGSQCTIFFTVTVTITRTENLPFPSFWSGILKLERKS